MVKVIASLGGDWIIVMDFNVIECQLHFIFSSP